MQSEIITKNSEGICFLCFSNYVTVYVENTRLQKLYEELLFDKMHSGSEPLCYICYKRLLQWEQLVRQIQYILKTDHHQGQETQLLKLSATHNYSEVPPEYSNKHEPDVKKSLKQCKGSAELKLDLSGEHYKDDHASTNEFDHLSLDIKEEIITTDLEKCKETSDGIIVTGKQVSKEQKPDVKPYICLTCDKKFSRNQSLKRHIDIIHNRTTFTCDTCSKKFNNKSSLAIHIRTHTGEKPYRCKHCNKKFTDSSGLNGHLKTHSNKPYSCHICSKKFKHSSEVKSHLKVHRETKAFSCSFCSKKFRFRSGLDSHLKYFHKDYNPHSCNARNFTSSYNIKSHLKVHRETKAFSCSFCSKKFRFRSGLDSHLKYFHKDYNPHSCNARNFTSSYNIKMRLTAHTDYKPYVCDVCCKRYESLRSLNIHLRAHNDSKSYSCDLVKHKKMNTSKGNYTCDVCNKTFLSEYDLKRHIKIHTVETYFTCDMCRKDFKKKFNLLAHIRRTHNRERPHKCDVCGKGFFVLTCLKQHKVTHLNISKAYSCDICRKIFPKETDLESHKERHRTLLSPRDVRIVGQPPCNDICGKSYTTKCILMKHMKLHADEKPHNCEFCSKIFTKTSEYLKRNLKIHSGSKPL